MAMSSMPEQFSLRWNDFHANMSHSFSSLLECEDLVDVTLAAGGQFLHAHKVILSVCSPYFKELFKVCCYCLRYIYVLSGTCKLTVDMNGGNNKVQVSFIYLFM